MKQASSLATKDSNKLQTLLCGLILSVSSPLIAEEKDKQVDLNHEDQTMSTSQEPAQSSQQGSINVNGKFENKVKTNVMSLSKMKDAVHAFTKERSKHATPKKEIPIQSISPEQIEAAANNTVWRLGHSTLLFKLDNELWMTDPVFSDRASPSQHVGPKRFHPNPISLKDLPPIKGVVISHDHYDHLDKAAVKKLAEKVEHFYTPLKVGDLMARWGVAEENITQLDWWQSKQAGNITVTLTPTQHFSGRGLLDGRERLWGSWVIESSETKLFFSGDSGYFDGFKQIGERFGPFDMTFVETGAYNKAWDDIHMMPEQSVQAHIDLQGKWMYPIHNGTFDLALHAWFDPFEKVTGYAKERNVSLTTPNIGEAIDLKNPPKDNLWWQALRSAKQTLAFK